MATNGNDRLEQMDSALRTQALQGIATQGAQRVTAAPKPAPTERQVYDLAKQIKDTARTLRDWADYATATSCELENITAAFIANTTRMLGKLEK